MQSVSLAQCCCCLLLLSTPCFNRLSLLRLLLPSPVQAAFALRKMELIKAKKYLEDVLAHKRAIPFRRYSGNVGRTGQAKNEGAPAGQARWPAKSAEFLLNLLKNAESNAEVNYSAQQSASPTRWLQALADLSPWRMQHKACASRQPKMGG